MKDKMIKLNNGNAYYILESIQSNSGYYVLGASCNMENDNIDTDNLLVCEVTLINNEVSTKEITDKNLVKNITARLSQKYRRNALA